MEVGGAGVGFLIGWLLPAARREGPRAALASIAVIAAASLYLALAIGFVAGASCALASIGIALAHKAWRHELREGTVGEGGVK
jgi:hypothetical protein